MNKEEINKVLEELHTVRPEMLNEKGKRLFDAIMSIADERDELKRNIMIALDEIEEYREKFYLWNIKELDEIENTLRGK